MSRSIVAFSSLVFVLVLVARHRSQAIEAAASHRSRSQALKPSLHQFKLRYMSPASHSSKDPLGKRLLSRRWKYVFGSYDSSTGLVITRRNPRVPGFHRTHEANIKELIQHPVDFFTSNFSIP